MTNGQERGNMKKIVFLMFISCVLNAKIIDFNTALKLTLKNNKELKAKKQKSNKQNLI